MSRQAVAIRRPCGSCRCSRSRTIGRRERAGALIAGKFQCLRKQLDGLTIWRVPRPALERSGGLDAVAGKLAEALGRRTVFAAAAAGAERKIKA